MCCVFILAFGGIIAYMYFFSGYVLLPEIEERSPRYKLTEEPLPVNGVIVILRKVKADCGN